MNWSNKYWKLVGIPILAVAASQTIYGILFIASLALLQNMSSPVSGSTVLILTGVVSVLAGGLFLGRLLGKKHHLIWFVTGVVAAFWPWVSQWLMNGLPSDNLLSYDILVTLSATICLWYLTAFAGYLTLIKYPKSDFDHHLLKWVGIAVAIIISLNIFSWASIRFSKGYRMARKVVFDLPLNVEETTDQINDPWIASYRRFTTVIVPHDTSLFDFYSTQFVSPQYENVSSKFNISDPGSWQHIEEQIRDEQLDYYTLSSRWVDLSGQILVTLLLQAQRIDETQDWNTSNWEVQGLIYSRPYADPPQTPISDKDGDQTPGVPPVTTTEKVEEG
jgi:hypothetical protein